MDSDADSFWESPPASATPPSISALAKGTTLLQEMRSTIAWQRAMAGFMHTPPTSSRASVNRILRGFREQRIISTGGHDGRIVIHDAAMLERYVMD